jgi:peptidyl-prolyl cis-trans isomerase C
MSLYVNDEQVDEEEIQKEAERLRPHYGQMVARGKPTPEHEEQLIEWSRENVVERMLMRQAACNDPEPVPAEEIEKAFEEVVKQYGGKEKFFEAIGKTEGDEGEIRGDIERRLRLDRLLDRIAKGAPEPAGEEIKKRYDENVERFTAPEMVHASHIVRHPKPEEDPDQVRKEMREVLAELRSGKSFEELAATRSDCPENGGDLGIFPRGQMVEAFENIVFNLEPGQVSDIFSTEFGLHIAKLHEKRPPTPVPFEEVKEGIVRELTEEMRQKAIEDFVDAEKEKAVIAEK